MQVRGCCGTDGRANVEILIIDEVALAYSLPALSNHRRRYLDEVYCDVRQRSGVQWPIFGREMRSPRNQSEDFDYKATTAGT